MLFVLLSIGITSTAQTLKVSDQTTLIPLQGVIVEVNNQTYSTDSKGKLDISLFKNSNFKITFIGYESIETNYAELEKNQFKILLKEKSFQTNEVVIAASKFEVEKSKVAQKVVIIDAKEIGFANQQSTADLLQNSGQVLVQKSQQGGGSPIIRGFEANKVLMVVDGVRLNNAIYRAGHLQNSITLDQTIFERAEIVFGPGSVIYGSDALGGVMHFYTKDPTLSINDKLLTKTTAASRFSSSNNEFTEHVDFSIAGKKLGSLTSFTFSKFGDLRQGANRSSAMGNLGKRTFYQDRINGVDTMMKNDDEIIQVGTGFQQYDILQKILYKQSEKVSHLINFQYSNSTDVPRYDRLTEVNGSGIFKSAEWYYGPQKRMMLAYQLQLKNASFYDQGNITLAFQDIEESRHNRNWNSAKLNHRIENVKVYSVNFDFKKAIKSHELDYGIEANYNDVYSTASFENIVTGATGVLDTRYPDGGSSMQTIAAYITHSQPLGKKLILQEGIRLSNVQLNSKFNDKTFFPFPFNEINQNATAVNGSVGLIYNIGNGWRTAFNVATGFRAPNLDDLSKVFESTKGDTAGNASNLGSLIVPNPDLKPEKTTSFELSISKNFNNKLNVELTGFYTLLNDAIVTQNSTFNGASFIQYGDTLSQVQKNVNAAEATIYGISGDLSFAINNQIKLRSTLTYTYGRITSVSPQKPLDHIAPLYGKTSLIYSRNKFKVEVNSIYSAAKKLSDYNLAGEDNIAYATANGMPAWTTFNIKGGYQINENLGIQLGIDNLLDTNYRVFASGISASGRNVVIALRGNF